ncbi:5-oxoprolinase subunit C family protein [Salibacterium lacus]|uniref:Biotin-dependent carboxyltransferase family protein n=1 Tax=Salibacterium lacus TaxID=1898109 RepID=A0ABW5T6D0_9BACI
MSADEVCVVKKSGLFTTIQDAGRKGWQKKGIPPAGVMDEYAFQTANILTGNDGAEAVLEVTMLGPVLLFTKPSVVAVTGADLQPSLNNKPVDNWRSFRVRDGDELSFAGMKKGARAYIAVQGGFDGDEMLGSRSTYVKAGLGGMNGRALEKGDRLSTARSVSMLKRCSRLSVSLIPEYGGETVLRVLEGPESSAFTEESLHAFYQSDFTVSNDSDRMGCRMEEAPLVHRESADILSDAVDTGTIQAAADGKPMILMADRQTTGGYTRPASVIQVDLSKAAQLLPGETVRFEKVTLEHAHDLLKEQRRRLAALALASNNMQSCGFMETLE